MWRSAGRAAASACCSFTVANMAPGSISKKSHCRRQLLAYSDSPKTFIHSVPFTYAFWWHTRERSLESCQIQRHQKFPHLQPRPLFVPHASSCYLIPIFRRKCEAWLWKVNVLDLVSRVQYWSSRHVWPGQTPRLACYIMCLTCAPTWPFPATTHEKNS